MLDCPDIPTPAFCDFVEACYQKNAWTTKISQLEQPILNVFGTRDHLVPQACAQALRTVARGRYEEIAWDSGHIGPVISQRALTVLPKCIADFLDD